LRLIRIALLALIPALALGTLAAGCGDDTSPTLPDLSAHAGDMATPHAGDMAHGD
jgi:hypothetical protein